MDNYQTRNSRHSAQQGYAENMNQRMYSRQCGYIPDRYSINEKHGLSPRNNMVGTPIKKLLSEEMSKELEPRKRSPGLIARLMGLDGLPPQQPFENQQKWLLEKHSPRPLREETRKFSTSCERNHMNKEQQFKDVFEVMEIPSIQGRSRSSNRTAEVAENDIDFILRKYISAKRPTSNSMIHNPKLFDPSKELLSRFSDIFHPHLSLQRNSALLADIACPKHSESRLRSSRYRFNKEENTSEPTRIVILKPNLKRRQPNLLSPQSSESFSRRGRSKQPVVLLSSKQRPKETPVRKRSFSAATLRGYAGDDSSTYVSDCDSSYDSEKNWVPNNGSYSPYANDYSTTGNEAQKRLPDRWRLNQKSIDVSVNEGSTLGEMLAKCDSSMKLQYHNGNSIASTSKSLPSSPRRAASPDTLYTPEERYERTKMVIKHESFSKSPKASPDKSRILSISEVTDAETENTPLNSQALLAVSESPKRLNWKSPVNSPSECKELQHRSNDFGSESKENEQPSPNSVLEASFADDVSAGECFGSLNADLQGLRKQLELLKMESETSPDRKMAILSDDEWEDESVNEVAVCESSMHFSYVNDMIIRSGIDDTDVDTYAASCESFDCPVSRRVFEQLEKKYCDVWQRHERMLLFDRTNCALSAIYWRFVRGKSYLRWQRNDVANAVRRYLLDDHKVCMLGRMLPCESDWLDLSDDFDSIGREVERMLTEELIADSFC